MKKNLIHCADREKTAVEIVEILVKHHATYDEIEDLFNDVRRLIGMQNIQSLTF